MHIFHTRTRSDQNILDKVDKLKTICPVLLYLSSTLVKKVKEMT